MKTAILTDSTSDLPSDIINSFDYLYTIPLNIHFKEENFRDGEEISSERFFARINKTGEIPSTSQPSVGEFLKTYEHLGEEYDQILSIHLSAELSGTISSAHTAAQQIEKVDIEIFDSGSASLGLGFMVMLAAELLEKGQSFQEVIKILSKAKNKTHVYFTVDDLTYLKEGGRIGKARAFLGSILNFHPLLTLPAYKGEVVPRGKARGKKRFEQKLMNEIRNDLADDKFAWLGVLHGSNPDNARDIQQTTENILEELNIESRIYSNIISPVLGCHTGPSVYGLALMNGEFLNI